MKALTLHQPHADLVRRRLKLWETRSWRTEKYIGELLVIHASQSTENDYLAVRLFPAHYAMQNDPEHQPLAHSECLCVVKLKACYRTEEIKALWQPFLENGTPEKKRQIAEIISMGDFSNGRWAWELEYVCELTGITDVAGTQRIWDLPPEIEEEVVAQMREKGIHPAGGGKTEIKHTALIA